MSLTESGAWPCLASVTLRLPSIGPDQPRLWPMAWLDKTGLGKPFSFFWQCMEFPSFQTICQLPLGLLRSHSRVCAVWYKFVGVVYVLYTKSNEYEAWFCNRRTQRPTEVAEGFARQLCVFKHYFDFLCWFLTNWLSFVCFEVDFANRHAHDRDLESHKYEYFLHLRKCEWVDINPINLIA